jgi:hypothetical protein
MSTEFSPTNEQGVIVVFAAQAQSAGWEFVSIGASFPDAVLRKNGEEWRVEFEYRASNFLDHKHDHRECDLIVCWENDYTDNPIPTIALCDPSWTVVAPSRATVADVTIEYWKRRALRAEGQRRAAQIVTITRDPNSNRFAVSDRQRAVELAAQGIGPIDIAKQMNVNVNTIRSWLHRATRTEQGQSQ